jgi:tRNA nucleotidyltransferase (CCA-adding enzyme)
VYIDERLDPEERALLARVGEVASEEGGAAWLVGGPVRDLLLERPAPDLDVAVEGPVEQITRSVAERLDAVVCKTTRFMTATIRLAGDLELDLARTRIETYPKPGALPVVEAATLADDLSRRDFSINAMAMALDPRRFGELIDPLGGRDDVAARHLRVLHDRSFEDDPTRMLRAVRFMLRLNFELEAHTRELLECAVDQRRAAGLSGARLRNELAVIFAEAPVRGLPALAELHIFEGMGLRPVSDRACSAVGLLPRAARALDIDLTEIDTLAACLTVYAGRSEQEPAELAEFLMLEAPARDAVVDGAEMIARPPEALTAAATDSELFFALRGTRAEVALAAWTALDDDGRERLQRYWREMRGAAADIDGADLIAAGYEPGPGFTQALEAALAAKLDQGANRAAQLRVAGAKLDDPL